MEHYKFIHETILTKYESWLK